VGAGGDEGEQRQWLEPRRDVVLGRGQEMVDDPDRVEAQRLDALAVRAGSAHFVVGEIGPRQAGDPDSEAHQCLVPFRSRTSARISLWARFASSITSSSSNTVERPSRNRISPAVMTNFTCVTAPA